MSKTIKIKKAHIRNLFLSVIVGFGAFHIAIECQKRSNGSNCMYDTGRAEYISASIFPLQNKDACIKYAELFNSLH